MNDKYMKRQNKTLYLERWPVTPVWFTAWAGYHPLAWLHKEHSGVYLLAGHKIKKPIRGTLPELVHFLEELCYFGGNRP